MRMVYYDINFIFDIIESGVTSLVLENSLLFEKFLLDIHEQILEDKTLFMLYDDEEEVDIPKRCDIITDIFDISFNKRGFQKRFLAEVEKTSDENDISQLLCDINSENIEALERLRLEVDYEMEFAIDFNIADIFKHFGVKLKEPSGRFAERIIDYITVSKKLLGKDCFFIVNCDAFLSTEDYEHLYKFAKYQEVSIVYIRNRQLELPKFKNEYIIDMDLCEIH